MTVSKSTLIMFALVISAACTTAAGPDLVPTLETHFTSAALPEDLVALYGEAAAYRPTAPLSRSAPLRIDVRALAGDKRVQSAIVVPYDEQYWYEPIPVRLIGNAGVAELPMDRDLVVILDLGERARNNYQVLTQLRAAGNLIPDRLRPSLCNLILCSPEPFRVDTLMERLPELSGIRFDLGTVLPPVEVGPVAGGVRAICDDCFEIREPNILPCLLWKWCGSFPLPRRDIYVRKNIYTLTAGEINTLRSGVAAMKARPASDPTSWIYQARMHAVDSGLAAALQDQCQHRQFLFFSWHRMYVYYFERILRKASGDPNFALPYWNYSDDPAQRIIPDAYRLPADTNSNSLFNATRQAAYNQGVALPAADVTYTAGFNETNFAATSAGVPSFGGRAVTAPAHFPVPSPGSGQIELSPHNNVHNDISGDMASGESPRDPLFWLHHANIDRLWKRWIALGNGRSNPTADAFWMNHVFTFFDENGAQIPLTGAQILDTVSQLGYRYDDDPLVIWPLWSLMKMAPLRRFMEAAPLVFLDQRVLLHRERVDVRIPLSAEVRNIVARASRTGRDTERIVLQLNGIEYDEPVGLTYLIFLNHPAGARLDHEAPSFVGTLGFFGSARGLHHAAHEHGVAEEYDITRVLSRMEVPEELVVSLVPSLPVAPSGREDLQRLIDEIEPKGRPRFRAISLLLIRME
ncbi:MAG TPA: tyrosinase family protein [Thermoanaerobaculia bacterium]|nr:tyrosinase family protein [Thermoanaerobaculia bacterium]